MVLDEILDLYEHPCWMMLDGKKSWMMCWIVLDSFAPAIQHIGHISSQKRLSDRLSTI